MKQFLLFFLLCVGFVSFSDKLPYFFNENIKENKVLESSSGKENRSKKENKKTQKNSIPSKYKLPKSPINLFYTYNKELRKFEVAKTRKSDRQSYDPIRFTIHSNQDSVRENQEFTITITAELLDVSPQSMFVFEDQKAFSLKVIFPDNFIQTGGDYYDFVGSDFRKSSSKLLTYYIKGKYLSHNAGCFKLLRGPIDVNDRSLFVEKAVLCIPESMDKVSSNPNARLSAPSSTPVVTWGGDYSKTGFNWCWEEINHEAKATLIINPSSYSGQQTFNWYRSINGGPAEYLGTTSGSNSVHNSNIWVTSSPLIGNDVNYSYYAELSSQSNDNSNASNARSSASNIRSNDFNIRVRRCVQPQAPTLICDNPVACERDVVRTPLKVQGCNNGYIKFYNQSGYTWQVDAPQSGIYVWNSYGGVSEGKYTASCVSDGYETPRSNEITVTSNCTQDPCAGADTSPRYDQNVGDPFCSGGVQYQRKRNTNGCSANPGDEQNFATGNNAACGPCNGADTSPRYDQNVGDPFCSGGVQYQRKRNTNGCSANPGDEQNFATGNNAACSTPPPSSCNFVVSGVSDNQQVTGSCNQWTYVTAGCSGDCSGISYSWAGPNGFSQQGPTLQAMPTENGSANYTVTIRKDGCSEYKQATIVLTTNNCYQNPCAGADTSPRYDQNVGDPFCSGGVQYQRKRNTNGCSANPGDEQNFATGNNAACGPCNGADTSPRYDQNVGDPFCSGGVQYQRKRNTNGCSANPGDEQNFATGNNAACTPTSCAGVNPGYAYSLDQGDCNAFGGWALDRNCSQSLTLQVFVDNQFFTTITANGQRTDVPPALGLSGDYQYCGFRWVPTFGGTHTVSIRLPNGQAVGQDVSLTCSTTPTDPCGSATRPADNVSNLTSQINYRYFGRNFPNDDVDGISGQTPTAQGITNTFTLDANPSRTSENFGYEFTGYVHVSAAGQYTFFTDSDDGTKLWIGDQQIVDNNYGHGTQTRSGTICLAAGYHAIRVRYTQGGGGFSLAVRWQGPGFGVQDIPASVLFRQNPLGTPTAPTFSGGSNAFTCQGTAMTFTSSCPSGGSVHWSRYDTPNGTLIGQATLDNLPFGGENPAGQYYYSVECVSNGQKGPSQTFTFNVNPKPSLTLYSRVNNLPFGTPSTQSVCEGGNVAFGRSPFPVPAGYTLQWRGPNGSASIVNQDWDVNNITSVQGGPYTYTVIDEKGCSNSASINVEVLPKPAAPAVLTNVSSLCGSGSATLTATGCSGWIVWQDAARPGVELQVSRQAPYTFTVSPTQTTTYQAFCQESACNSTMSAPVTVAVSPVPDPPVLSSSASSIITGQSVTLTASGCGGTVTWSTGQVGPTSITVSPTQTTTYNAICTTFPAGGGYCQSAGSSITITVNGLSSATAPTFNGGSNAFTCQGTNVLFASSCPGGGQVHWSRYNAPGGSRISEAFDNSITLGGDNPAGQYYYSVECVANGQQGPARSFTFTVNLQPTATGLVRITSIRNFLSNASYTVCEGDSAAFGMDRDSTASGYRLRWIDPSGTTRTPNWIVDNVTKQADEGWYTYTVTTPQGCQATSRVQLNVTQPAYDGVQDPASCQEISGWLVNKNCHEKINVVRIVVDDRQRAMVPMTRQRADAKQATLGTGAGFATYGYGWSVPADLQTGRHKVQVFTLDGNELPPTRYFGVDAPPSVSTNTSSLCAGGSATLTATGCSGWIVWQDAARPGVELQVSRQAPYTFTVSPTQTTTYQAFCQESACNSTMSAPVTVAVSPVPDPPVLSSSASSIITGQSVTLTASGCGGTVTWSTGQVGPTSITVSPTQTTTYNAICTTFPAGGGYCQSAGSSITITVNGLSSATAPTFNGSSNAFTGQGTEVTFASSCPSGNVHWSRYDAPNGTRIGEAFGSTLLFGGTMAPGTYYYSVECVANGQQGPARSFTFTVNNKPTFGFTAAGTNSSASASSVNGPASLTATICDGGHLSLSGLTWAPNLRMFEHLRSNGNVQGVSIDRAPNDLGHELTEGIFNQGHGPNRLVNPAAEGIMYQDYFAYQDNNGNGQYDAGTDYASEIITLVYRITPKPAAPVVSTNVSTLCGNGSATLTATGCSGWIVWQDVARPGVELQVSRQAPYTFTVSPTQTTTYQAFCQESACNSTMSAPVTITVEQATKPTNVLASPSTISSTQSVTLTAQGCANTTRWEWNGTSAIGARLVTTLNQTTVFGVRCVSAAGCQSDTASVTVRFINIPTPIISASKLRICGSDSLILQAQGCPTGSVARWSNNMTGNIIRFVPSATATYYAVCKQGDSEGGKSTEITVRVDPVPTVLGLLDSYELGNTISLTATASGADSYKWIDPQGNTINGAVLRRLGAGMSYAGSYMAVATYNATSCSAYTVVIVRINGTSLTTGAVSPAAACAGSSVSVPYSSTYTFGASNQFSVLLSDATGGFNNPQVIGTGTSSPITCVVPTTIAAGSGYRVRVVSSTPASDGETSPTTLTITAAFSVSATSNSNNQQRVVGDTLRLNSTVVPAVNGASYNWRGPNNFSSAQANPVIPGSTTATNGTYTLTVSSPSGCSASAQTSVLLNTDTTRAQRTIRIKAVDSTPKETDLIPRTNGGLGSLNLSVEELDGLDLTGYTYQWSRPVSSTGTTPTTATTPTLTAGKIGEYKVVLTKGVDTLVAYTTLRAKPCKQVAHTYQCGHLATAVGSLNDTGISSLAPGDTIRTGDFDVIVTEINGGGIGGWSGKGYTQVPYLGDTHIAVDFTNAKVNDCYEYTGGGVVQSAFDASWGNVADVDTAIDRANQYFASISQRFDSFKSKLSIISRLLENPERNAVAIRDSLVNGQAEFNSLLSEATCVSDEEKTQLKQEYEQLKAIAGTPGGRVAALSATANWSTIGQNLVTGFDKAKACTQEQIDIVLTVIQFLRKNTEFPQAQSHAKAFSLSGDARCAQMFTEGFLNELISQIDIKTLQEEIKKNVGENLRQVLQGEHRYQNLLDCFSPKLAVTGDLSAFKDCSGAVQLVLSDLLGGTISLYNNIKSFASNVYDCQCIGNNSPANTPADNCSYSVGRLTAFSLSVLAPGASKFARVARAFKTGSSEILAQRIKSLSGSIKAGRIAEAVASIKYGILFENQALSAMKSKIASGAIKRVFPDILTVEQEAVIRFYTTREGYKGLNAALRGESVMTEFYETYKNVLSNALDKLPKKGNVTVYRGMGPSEAISAERLVKGDVLEPRNFFSTTLEQDFAVWYSEKQNTKVIYQISSKSGVSIGTLSEASHEAEILFKPSIKYKVVDVSFLPRFVEEDPIIKVIFLEEI